MTRLNPRLNNLGPRGNLHVSILHNLVKGCDHISLSKSVARGFICIRSQRAEGGNSTFSKTIIRDPISYFWGVGALKIDYGMW